VRVLVTGAGGPLGGRLAARLQEAGLDVTAVWRETPPPGGLPLFQADLTEPGAVDAALAATRPDAVVHAAVVGRADYCEEHPDLAFTVNVRLPERLARACRESGCRLVALSTDLVFDGTGSFRGPEAPARPLGAYGRTKRAGEEAVLAACPAAAVARVALVVGRGHGARGTASESVAWALRAGRGVRLFTDEYRTPVDPESVATGVALLLRRGGTGLYHLGGPERLSRLELGVRAARALGLPTEGLEGAPQSSYTGRDPRPADTSLDSARARDELGWHPRPLDEALAEGRPCPPAES